LVILKFECNNNKLIKSWEVKHSNKIFDDKKDQSISLHPNDLKLKHLPEIETKINKAYHKPYYVYNTMFNEEIG